MEPYREDRPIIYVDKDKIKQNILETILSLPGARALKNFHDNPEGNITETLDLLAEDVVPFYGNYRNGGDIGDYVKEAAMFGIPMPYTKFPKGHPKAGEAIPNNLKEGLGYKGWATAKSLWKNNKPAAKKLYTDPNDMLYRGSTEGGLSTRARVGTTADARDAIEVPAGPYRETNTGSNLINNGRQAINSNTVRTKGGTRATGANAWQGDMYPPGRSLARLDEAGPYIWDAVPDQREYIRKLNDVINENENKWEYLINKTRSRPSEGIRNIKSTSIVPKDDIVSIALAQGRPDIAARTMADDGIRVNYMRASKPGYNQRFNTYSSVQHNFPLFKDNAVWKDYGNRQVEKELREQFAMLPEDDLMRQKFADYYGVPDLYNDWIANPEYWKEFSDKTRALRNARETANRYWDRKYGRNINR